MIIRVPAARSVLARATILTALALSVVNPGDSSASTAGPPYSGAEAPNATARQDKTTGLSQASADGFANVQGQLRAVAAATSTAPFGYSNGDFQLGNSSAAAKPYVFHYFPYWEFCCGAVGAQVTLDSVRVTKDVSKGPINHEAFAEGYVDLSLQWYACRPAAIGSPWCQNSQASRRLYRRAVNGREVMSVSLDYVYGEEGTLIVKVATEAVARLSGMGSARSDISASLTSITAW